MFQRKKLTASVKKIGLILVLFISALYLYSSAVASQLLADEQNTIAIFKKASPFVVTVYSLRVSPSAHQGLNKLTPGSGSGILWDDSGHVVTNYHVIRHAARIVVSLGKGKLVRARVMGIAPRKDLALLKLESNRYLQWKIRGATYIPLADPANLQVGQKTIAIGNPFGLTRTLTTGIISALGRRVPGVGGVTIRDMIQTDASINPGNSGGPLLNSRGELIGMNTMIYAKRGAPTGIGFAVAVGDIKRTVSQLIRHGRVVMAGIGIQRLSDEIAKQLGVKGVIIAQVIPDTPAKKAGLRGTERDDTGELQLGDIIVGIDSEPVRHYDDLYNILVKKKVGTEIKLHYIRKGKLNTVTIKTIDLHENE